MKLVQLLAKELKEWPDNNLAEFSALFVAQDDDGMIVTLDPEEKPDVDQFNGCSWSRHSWTGGDLIFEVAEDHATSIITRDQWQAEREKMNKPKWIRHRGGKCPVKAGTKVVTRYRDGVVSDWCMTRNQDTEEECLSAIWSHSGGETDIMAYYVEETKDQEIKKVKVTDAKLEMMHGDSWVNIGRVAPNFGASVFDGYPLPKPEEVKDANLGTLNYKLEIDATEATQRIDSLVAKWGQIESPLKWRDEIIELEAYEEEFRREREKLIRKLESEGFKLIDHMAPVYGEQIIDMSDWRNWQPGDIVECLIAPDKHEGYYFSGINYKINEVDLDDEGAGCEISVYCERAMSLWCPSSSFKFIRRP